MNRKSRLMINLSEYDLLLTVSLTAPFIITRNKRLADLLRRETE